jgi:hypothetical protein
VRKSHVAGVSVLVASVALAIASTSFTAEGRQASGEFVPQVKVPRRAVTSKPPPASLRLVAVPKAGESPRPAEEPGRWVTAAEADMEGSLGAFRKKGEGVFRLAQAATDATAGPADAAAFGRPRAVYYSECGTFLFKGYQGMGVYTLHCHRYLATLSGVSPIPAAPGFDFYFSHCPEPITWAFAKCPDYCCLYPVWYRKNGCDWQSFGLAYRETRLHLCER